MNPPHRCAAVVVGAGPAGIAALGSLLERQLGKIVWVDPLFDGGRVNRKYREVPSNTKVTYFESYATALQPFRNVVRSTPVPNAFTSMLKLDHNETCSLHYAGDVLKVLIDGLAKHDQVYPCRGMVTMADLKDKAQGWTVHIRTADSMQETEVIAARLILCTGASPTVTPIPVSGLSIERLDLDTVLKPSELCRVLSTREPTTVAVIGASHSAILVLLNLYELARSTHSNVRVKWFTRHALRYAEFMDGWILRDNTGLKGQAAQFAHDQLEDDRLPTSDAGKFIDKIDCSGGGPQETQAYELHLPQCTHIVHAVGYSRDPVPPLSRNGTPLDSLEFDHTTGDFRDVKADDVIRGLHGAGIAFPERVVDPYGNVEYAVGFFKFMKFLKRVAPTWT